MAAISPPVPTIWDGTAGNGALSIILIPYTETEVNAPERFESDFMVQYLRKDGACPLSVEANAVLDAGRILWKAISNIQTFAA